jgi:hypothetical protein
MIEKGTKQLTRAHAVRDSSLPIAMHGSVVLFVALLLFGMRRSRLMAHTLSLHIDLK